jgi:Protein of unknown function (DUF3738)
MGPGHAIAVHRDSSESKIDPVVIEGDPDLFDMVLDGDWIVQEDATDGQKVLALDRIIQRSLRQGIGISLRQVVRDVIVASGRYRPSVPILAGDRIQIYGRRLNKGEAGGGGDGMFPNFLEALRDWINRPILDETEAPPKGNIGWGFNERSPFAERRQRDDNEESLVLQQLREQTGLEFRIERRPMRVLFLERAK